MLLDHLRVLIALSVLGCGPSPSVDASGESTTSAAADTTSAANLSTGDRASSAGSSTSPIYQLGNNDKRTLFFINVAECDTSDCGVGKRIRAGSFGTICDWIDTRPSSYFSNVEC